MEEIGDLEWTKSTETLEDLLQNPKVKLPQLIKLASELEFLDSKTSLQQGQILNVLAKQTISYVNGTDSHGKDISLPLCCPYTVKLKVSPNNERTFNSVEGITNCDPLPKFVEVINVASTFQQDPEQAVAVGDILKLVFVEKSGHVPSFVHFRNSAGTHIKINVNEELSFHVAIGYSANILLSSLFEQHNRDFPAYIQFYKQDKIPKSYLELGMITLHRNSITMMEVVVASANASSSEYVVIYPLKLAVKFEVNTKLKLANDKNYRDLCTNYSNISVEDVNCYLDEMIGFKQNEHRVMMKYKKLRSFVLVKECTYGIQGTNHSSKLKDKKEDKIISKQTTQTDHQNGTQCPSQNSKSKVKKEDTTKQKSEGKEKNVKSKQKAKEDSTENQKNEEKEIKVKKAEKEKKKKKSLHLFDQKSENGKSENSTEDSTENQKSEEKETKAKKAEKEKTKKKSQLSDQKSENGKSENFYSHAPSLLSKVKSIKIKKEKSNKSVTGKKGDGENKHEKPVIENLYSQIDYEMLEKIQDEIAKSPSLPLVEPPPLPGNHPCQGKMGNANNKGGIYVDAINSKSLSGGFYFDKESYSAIEISTWGMEEVGLCLTNLLMDEHKTVFEDNLIDGKLLLDIDESVLVELGLDIFEARKLREFVLGWRPGSTRPTSIYPPLKGFTSDDPSDWDVDDAASHMLEIDVPEMADFCRENQVDGELLKEICVDTPIMNSICPGKKLKVVKIKNYVVDKWRPKKKTDDPYETVVKYDGISDKISSNNQKATSDSPLVARMKHQLEEKSHYSGVYEKSLLSSK